MAVVSGVKISVFHAVDGRNIFKELDIEMDFYEEGLRSASKTIGLK